MLTLAITLFSIAVSNATPASTQPQARSLPNAPYSLFAGNDMAANFLVNSTVRRSGDVVRLTTYKVYRRAISTPEGQVDQDTTDLEINCAQRTYRHLAVNAYRTDGSWAFSLPAEATQPIEPNMLWDFAAQVVCGDVGLPDSATVDGPAAARALGLERLR